MDRDLPATYPRISTPTPAARLGHTGSCACAGAGPAAGRIPATWGAPREINTEPFRRLPRHTPGSGIGVVDLPATAAPHCTIHHRPQMPDLAPRCWARASGPPVSSLYSGGLQGRAPPVAAIRQRQMDRQIGRRTKPRGTRPTVDRPTADPALEGEHSRGEHALSAVGIGMSCGVFCVNPLARYSGFLVGRL